ncbi:hypothetical protein P2A78_18605 [Xanthomonas perforans]|uniref:Uncharacterized protein n=2 Tax=Xanthomonas hortorum TaxID=56454 RepID=A0A6V7FH66_9XANT|nr:MULTISPECIES: hypothetical protein [Xanthomonas]APR13300.1 hypothetical protein BI314_23975 [Xanthomonas citri pv. citri]APR17858.1 hypothetical protein BI315_23510 [Xanthomonas citri pv. citri]APR22632.1 hypothetical protein BI316_23935 [Xanthomonas citri pv. citri]APR27270.1 hypothetical protein BJD09_23805 [Xanthomonas citri pv. citri]AUZ53553.1 hypothetical protein CLM98_23660 [Xanthomonas citri pv. citri]
MSNLVRPQVFNGLLEKAGLAQLDPGEISVLFSSIPPQYGQSLVAGLQQKDATSTNQIRAWALALKLHSRIIKSISNTISLSAVYATCKLKGAKLVGDLLASVERGDANATEFLTAHLREGFKAVRAQGLPALLGLSGAPAPAAGQQQEHRQSAPSNNGINSMPPPGDDADTTSGQEHPRQQHRPGPQQERQHQRDQHHVQPQRHNQQQSGGQQRQHQPPSRSDNRSQSQQARDYEDRRVVSHPTRDRQQQGSSVGPRVPEESKYDQKACFGRDTAIQFERCVNNQNTNYTVNIAIAKANGQSTRGGMNWDGKITLMCVPKEVQLITAVLRGFLPKARFAGHGANNEKWIEVQETADQYAGAIRFTIAQGKDIRNVNVGPDDVGEVLAMFYRTCKDQLKEKDGYLVDQAIRRAADLHTKSQAAKEARGGAGGGQRQQGNGYGQQRRTG